MIEFISRLPQGYQEVEYIKSSGTQYIDTGYKPTSNNLRIVCEFEYTADHSTSSVFGSESSSKYSIVPWGAPKFYVGSSTDLLAQTTALNTKYVLDAHANAGTFTVSLNGKTNSASYSGSILTTVNIGIFCNIIAGIANDFCSMKLYAMYIYDNGNLVRDFVPCYRKSDNVAGLYDLVNNVFYTNAGSGVFAVGANSNKHTIATITPGGVISFSAALRRRMMMAGGGGVSISDLPLGALINVGTDGGAVTQYYEIADKDNLVSGGVVLVRKNIYSNSEFGSNTYYPDGTLDNLIKTTIYNRMPQRLRDIMMDVSFNLSGSGDITRKMFAPTYTMMGFGNNSGNAEGKALQLYTSNASRKKTFDGSTALWWLSSQYSSDYAWYVFANGSLDGSYPSAAQGVVPAFVIPSKTPYDPTPNPDGSYNLFQNPTISDLPLGTLINVSTDGGAGTPNYEIADKDNLVSGDVVLVRKNIHSKSAFGSSTAYPNGTLDNLIKTTIYNEMPQKLRDKMMDVTFTLSGSGDITRKMFALTKTMAGLGNNSGVAEGKALQLYTSDASRKKTFNGTAAGWWLSSQSYSDYAWDVRTDGSAYGSHNSSNSYGVVPAFVISSKTPYDPTPNTDGSYNLIL